MHKPLSAIIDGKMISARLAHTEAVVMHKPPSAIIDGKMISASSTPSETAVLVEQLKALTAALTAQTTAISQLVNSNLEIVDQMMAAEPEEGNLSGYLDG